MGNTPVHANMKELPSVRGNGGWEGMGRGQEEYPQAWAMDPDGSEPRKADSKALLNHCTSKLLSDYFVLLVLNEGTKILYEHG